MEFAQDHADQSIEVANLDHGSSFVCDVIPWSLGRLCNQAFFTELYVDEDGDLRAEHLRPFDVLLDPGIQADATTWANCTRKHTRPKPRQIMDQAKV